ncbi:MAG: hypothetical protein JNM69_17440 [Archangium sp.]|nr:hypothetical protein [Archangium sp.]
MTLPSMRRTAAACCLGLALVLAGCPQPPANNDGGGNTGGGSACTPGTVGCGCDNSSCSSGECVDGACVACQRGSASCVCRANGTCDMGLRCGNGKCETCPPGQNGCACNGTTCNAGLTCSNGTCAPDTCTPGAPGCPCRTQGPVCDNNAYCDTSSRCQTCSPDVKGCACSSTSTCLGGLVCNMATMQCRDAVTCAQLRTPADGGMSCAPNQLCTMTSGQDAVCVPGMCEPNFKFDALTNTCIACVSANCANEPTCTGPGGLAATMCDGQNRVCNQSGMVAACGACKPGFTENGSPSCAPVPRCGSTTCGLTEYCDTSGTAPACLPLPCPSGQAKEGANGTCSACTTPVSCMGAGYSGRYWPFRTAGRCICETLDGYFEPGVAAGAATLCDADNDGWVNARADGTDITGNPVLKANARCTIRKVDRIRLVEETGVSAEVHSCTNSMSTVVPPERLADGGLAPLFDGGWPSATPGPSICPTNQVLPIRLLESPRNDRPGEPLTEPNQVPVWGDGGRLMEANELNALTKGCITGVTDLNDNNVDDIREVQPSGASADDQVRLQSFAYYIELYTSYYEASATDLGVLVIKERSRCDPGFPLRYDPSAVRTADGGANDEFLRLDGGSRYWRSCERRRDPAYNEAVPAPGFDFAQWTCPATTGTCAFRDFPSATQVGPTSPRTTFFRDFGRCNLGGALPVDMRWRGFGHHSQFKCVEVVSSATPTREQLNTSAFDAGVDGYAFNNCVAVPCNGTGSNCRTTPGAGAQTAQPVINCTANYAPQAGSVGFAAVGYRPYGNTLAPFNYPRAAYTGGCVNEDTESEIPSGTPDFSYQSYLCPYPEFSRTKGIADRAFGRHSCYLQPANFLWSGPTPQRATLRWSSPDAGAGTLNGVWRN